MRMKRKRLSNNDNERLWNAFQGKCWRCGLPIDQHRRGELHWGHIIAHSLGGASDASNMAPEHASCNSKSARTAETPVAAKTKRVAIRHIERPEPKIKWSKKMNGPTRRAAIAGSTRRTARLPMSRTWGFRTALIDEDMTGSVGGDRVDHFTAGQQQMCFR